MILIGAAISETDIREVRGPIADLDRIVERDFGNPPLGKPLHVGGPAEFLTSRVVPAVGDLVADGMRLRFDFGLADELLARLADGELDLVLSTIRPRMCGITATALVDEEFALVASAKACARIPAGRLAAEGPAVLEEFPLIAYAEYLPIVRRYWRDVFASASIRAPAVVVPDLRGVLAVVKSAGGISVLPTYLCADDLAGGELVALLEPEIPPINTLYLATRSGAMVDADLATLHDHLLAKARLWNGSSGEVERVTGRRARIWGSTSAGAVDGSGRGYIGNDCQYRVGAEDGPDGLLTHRSTGAQGVPAAAGWKADLMEIDHVVLAARSSADAERVLGEAGLGVARGRVMPGLGLSNLVVPLRSDQILEIHYPNGEEAAPDAPPLLRFELEAFEANPDAAMVAMAWLVAFEDELRLREVAAANEMSVVDVPAEGPGFPPYVLAGFGANFERRYLPCPIHWPEGMPPLDAAHRRRPTGITRIDVSGPAEEIETWCGGEPNGLRTFPGTVGPLRVEIGFEAGGPVVLGLPE
ncbi:LysR substrate-binding domain-containing protein [Glycomyces buryatensis]|uniref:LysR substrate-binding domain-containing protein n=1 Tax=Glycomyces buryatensis TaxID=2570927 RepID=A0A4S8PTK3_9ACTN|nr:LysR substrate-binding domain-containing protein [Glycomyces buryatensis]THV34688.1 hypothetical protein FAB82_23860 [Glycomyces buryatensis]